MEDSVASDMLTVTDLVEMFESSEEATNKARKQSERDRDYHDNIQLTTDELKTLKKRGQPPYIDNRIKTKVDYLVGLEKQQRINPRALPRTPQHEDDADSASQALNYVADTEQFDYKRSAIWRNLLIEGAGGMAVAVEQDAKGQYCVRLRRIPWDRMFWDPHSSEVDYSDATYLGTVQWMDQDDAIAFYGDNPEAADIIETTLSTATMSDTFDDKPKFNLWADRKRRRVRIVSIWLKRGDEWHFAEFTKGGILKAGPSPYRDDEGKSDCELFFQSAYVDRDNNRFGLVREMILIQDAINKRNSKALHLLNTSQIVTTAGAVDDIEKARREAARPDGVIVVNPINNGGLDQNFKFETRTDLAQGQFQLLQEAKNSIDLKGPNATAMGDKAQGANAASGKAIIASQQGGMISLGDLLDNLRHLDLRVFRAIWNRIRQFWNGEKWIRVTDDEQNVKWVGVNVDPQQVQYAAQQNPAMAGRIKGVISNIAYLDCDIIIDEAPDSLTPALEQWQALVELKKAGADIPEDVLISAAPNLKNKKALLDKLKQPNPQRQMAQKLELEGKAADNAKTQADAMYSKARAMQAMQPVAPEAPDDKSFERWAKLLDSATRITVAQVSAGSTQAGNELNSQLDAMLHFSGLHADAQAQLREQAHERAMLSLQPPPAQAAA